MSKASSRFDFERTPPTWVLLVLSGILLGLAYPPNPLGLFGSVGLLPLLIAVERANSYRQLFRWSYLSLLLFSALSSWWVGSWQAKADPFLMISCILLVLIHPLFFVVPILIYRAVGLATSRIYALVFLPFLWCGGEYLHALGDASYPWLTLGNTQTYNLYYIQFIEFTGVWGLSFLLMVQNALFAALVFSMNEPRPRQLRIVVWAAVIFLFTLVPPFIYGFYVVDVAKSHPAKTGLAVTVVQPNIDPWDKWNTADTTDHIQLNGGLSRASLTSIGPTELFLWSETAIPQPLTQPGFEGKQVEMRQMVDALGVPVLTGFADYKEYPDRSQAPSSSKMVIHPLGDNRFDTLRYDHFNSAGLFVPGQGLTGAYHKMQLVPFGERIPFVDAVPWLMSMISWGVGISTWGKGTEITTFNVPYHGGTARGATVVCFESVYPNMVRRFVDSGANFLTIVTNDGWYKGTPGPLQHERFAIMRAIETRRAIARAANTGISCFISPYGTIYGETEEGVQTTTRRAIELRDDRTLYVRWGDWWPNLCLIVAGGMIVYAIYRRVRFGERIE